MRQFAITTLVLLTALILFEDCATTESSRIADIQAITDQKLLEKLAIEDRRDYVRKIAVEKLNNQMILFKVAMEDSVWWVSTAAVEKLEDQSLFARVILEREGSPAGQEAMKRLTDPGLLLKVVKTSDDMEMRKEAIKKLIEQNKISQDELGVFAKSEIMREQRGEFSYMNKATMIALSGLTDSTILTEVIHTYQKPERRASAILCATKERDAEIVKFLMQEFFPDKALLELSSHVEFISEDYNPNYHNIWSPGTHKLRVCYLEKNLTQQVSSAQIVIDLNLKAGHVYLIKAIENGITWYPEIIDRTDLTEK